MEEEYCGDSQDLHPQFQEPYRFIAAQRPREFERGSELAAVFRPREEERGGKPPVPQFLAEKRRRLLPV
jgi:hypothetical protein